MNKAKLLKALAGLGFTDANPTADSVKAFIVAQNLDVRGEDGKAVDVDAIFKAPAKKTVVMSDDDETESEETNKEADDYKRLTKELAAAARGKDKAAINKAAGGDDAENIRKHSPEKWERQRQHKAYNIAANAGRTKFVDADQAEEFGAIMRNGILRAFGRSGDLSGRDKEIMEVVGRKAQTEGVATQGGVLVPTEYVNQLMYVAEPFGVARKVANVVNMTSDVQRHPRKTGIATMVPVSENGTIAESQNSYDSVELTAKKFGRIVRITNELFEDATVNVANDVAQSMVEAQQNAEDDCYFNGVGAQATANMIGLAGEVSGSTGALPSAAYVNSSSATWTSITINDVLANLAGVVENVDQNRLAYVCSRQFYYAVMLRLDVATSQFKPLSGGSLRTPMGMFMGNPVYFSQRMATATGAAAGTALCYFGDFIGGSMIGDRRALTIDQSKEAFWTSDGIGFRATSRFAVNIHGDGKGSTYGPIVALTSV